MSTAKLDRIEVFKAGSHRAIDGKVYAFSEADVAAIAAAYDPALSAAPLVLGHPKTDDPAWGWAKGLSAEGGVLYAETERVAPEFSEGVEAGRYRYVSAKFYPPGAAGSPKPDGWYLQHIGFLGATPPAVKGLQPAFAASEPADLVAFAAADAGVVKDLFRGLRDWMIEKEGLEFADKILPAWWLDMVDMGEPVLSPGFAEPADPAATPQSQPDPQPDPAFAEREAALAAREAVVASREAAFAERAIQAARDEDAQLLDGLVADGRLPPAQRARVAAILARLGGDADVAFAERDADPRAELRALLGGLGQVIAFAEAAAGDGFDGVADPGALASRARELVDQAQAAGRTLSTADAVRQASVG
jgi:hypothetical protein